MRSLALILSAASLLACTAGANDEHVAGDDGENAPSVGGQDDEVVSGGVSCRERTETAFRSGVPQSIKVITVGGKAIAKPTGHAFIKMQRAARSAGVNLTLTSGFRTQAEQQHLFDCFQTQSCNDGNLAARPGFSNHQSGVAVDLSTSQWLAANAGTFGFVRTVPSEEWHYEYRDGKDPGGPCSKDQQAAAEMPWESPKDGGAYKNGVWMKVHPKIKGAAIVKYSAGNFHLGESTNREDGFSVRYTFKQLGDRTLTAEAYDLDGKKVGESSVDVKIVN